MRARELRRDEIRAPETAGKQQCRASVLSSAHPNPRSDGECLPCAMSPVKRDMVRVHTNHISLQERVPEDR